MKVLRFHAESASHTKPHDGIMKAVEYHSPKLFRPLLNSIFEYYLKSGVSGYSKWLSRIFDEEILGRVRLNDEAIFTVVCTDCRVYCVFEGRW